MVKRLAGASTSTSTKFAPVPIFDYNKIPRVGIKFLSTLPLPTGRKIIARGLKAVKEQDAVLMKL